MPATLSGKTALITAASRGIGAACAKRHSSPGAAVLVRYVKDANGAT
jgi:NAD(P)-dependent dehydrogenase (short-subunit alcohol dehydrogenase family)